MKIPEQIAPQHTQQIGWTESCFRKLVHQEHLAVLKRGLLFPTAELSIRSMLRTLMMMSLKQRAQLCASPFDNTILCHTPSCMSINI